jgi:hypothetical protein
MPASPAMFMCDLEESDEVAIAAAFGTFGDSGGNADASAAYLGDEVALTAAFAGGGGNFLNESFRA